MKVKTCPILNKQCLQNECMWWTEMIVKNIQSGELGTEYNCAVSKLPGLMVEQLKNINGVQTAVESSRNETVKRQDQFINVVASRGGKLLNGA